MIHLFTLNFTSDINFHILFHTSFLTTIAFCGTYVLPTFLLISELQISRNIYAFLHHWCITSHVTYPLCFISQIYLNVTIQYNICGLTPYWMYLHPCLWYCHCTLYLSEPPVLSNILTNLKGAKTCSQYPMQQ